MLYLLAGFAGLILGLLLTLTLAVLIAASVVITYLRRENGGLVGALESEVLQDAPPDEMKPGEHFAVERKTANFLYLRDLVTGNRQIRQVGNMDDDDEPDHFWVETGMFSTPDGSPLED